MRFAFLLASLSTLAAQSTRIEIFSEFQRPDAHGRIVPTDQPSKRREILSPALLRNSHASFLVAVTVPARESYFLFTQSFPQNLFSWKIYELKFVNGIPDRVIEARPPYFGAMPDAAAAIEGQTTRVYLLDVWIPKDLPSQPARLEMLLKSGTWRVAPMELRVLPGTYPDPPSGDPVCMTTADQPLAALADCMVAAYLEGKNPTAPTTLDSARDFVARNIAQDLALARALDLATLEPLLRAHTPDTFDWYLRFRANLIKLAAK